MVEQGIGGRGVSQEAGSLSLGMKGGGHSTRREGENLWSVYAVIQQ